MKSMVSFLIIVETLAFDSTPMIKFASLPGMFERTLTIGSIGKMFGFVLG
jgi:kynurenine--oxoglutarate transaminase/cysteine-S-conjugate beta-lyase/glutamine--phenylpyruvate transaminase